MSRDGSKGIPSRFILPLVALTWDLDYLVVLWSDILAGHAKFEKVCCICLAHVLRTAHVRLCACARVWGTWARGALKSVGLCVCVCVCACTFARLLVKPKTFPWRLLSTELAHTTKWTQPCIYIYIYIYIDITGQPAPGTSS